MAGSYDITIPQGKKWVRTLAWYDQNLTPVDLTGYTAKLQVRKHPTDTSTALVSMDTSGNGITLASDGKSLTLTLSAAATGALNFDKGVYELVVTDASAVDYPLLRGTCTLEKRIVQ